jgi:hypothetical protein
MPNDWKYAKNKCGLDDTEVEMAKRLGFTPDKVLNMIPDKREQWKDIPPLRIRRLYDKKFGNRL